MKPGGCLLSKGIAKEANIRAFMGNFLCLAQALDDAKNGRTYVTTKHGLRIKKVRAPK
jgi:hypothetical protein